MHSGFALVNNLYAAKTSPVYAAGDNANEMQSQMVDNKLGRKLVSSLLICRTTFEAYEFPEADKFANGKHNTMYKRMSESLKDSFQTQGLQPYPFQDRPKGKC